MTTAGGTASLFCFSCCEVSFIKDISLKDDTKSLEENFVMHDLELLS